MSPMKFHQTYEVVTEESSEHGEADETGFDWQDVPYTFKELVDMLERTYRGCEPSSSRGVPDWITSYGDMDMHDGSYRNISLHPGNDRAKRWWPKALRAAEIIK
jgi:hypothetical protein